MHLLSEGQIKYMKVMLSPSGIEWGNYDSEPGRVIRSRFLRDFPMGFYNGVFQFMSKIKPVVNITWRYFHVLFYNVNCAHSYPHSDPFLL